MMKSLHTFNITDMPRVQYNGFSSPSFMVGLSRPRLSPLPPMRYHGVIKNILEAALISFEMEQEIFFWM